MNNYVIQLAGSGKKAWGANLRFGIVSPSLYTDAQFFERGDARQGAELALKTPGGTFSGFTNTNDEAPGGGAGVNVHQQMEGASWQARLPQWAQMRLMWLNVSDVGVMQQPERLRRGARSIAQRSVDEKMVVDDGVCGELRQSEHGCYNFASGVWPRLAYGESAGQPGKTNVNITYHDESVNFGNPANPGLTPDSTAQCARLECGDYASHAEGRELSA